MTHLDIWNTSYGQKKGRESNCRWCAPKFPGRPKKGPTMLKSGSSWNLVPLPASSIEGGGWEGHVESFGIRLRRGTTYLITRSCIKNQPTSWLVHFRNHYWCWDKSRATQIHFIHYGPNSGEATTFPHIVFSALLHCTHIRMAFCPRTPKVKSQNCFGLDSRDFTRS
jgi:hypothetical protein